MNMLPASFKMTGTELEDEILALLTCAAELTRRGSHFDDRSRERRRQLQGLIRTARLQYAVAFGLERGWHHSRAPFALTALSPQQGVDEDPHVWWNEKYAHDTSYLDHPFFYRYPERPFLPAAIAAHPYGRRVPAGLAALGDRLNIHAEAPDSISWWYPTQTSLLLYRCRPELHP
ncbi:hypothetical protein [Bradyrhizobium sp. I1.7.5]|uniref:hypothetical protein n=1 Tax=Bradyrhizobium sp. I1.7.5 TaxID=3156363 RepID=UPI0033990E77